MSTGVNIRVLNRTLTTTGFSTPIPDLGKFQSAFFYTRIQALGPNEKKDTFNLFRQAILDGEWFDASRYPMVTGEMLSATDPRTVRFGSNVTEGVGLQMSLLDTLPEGAVVGCIGSMCRFRWEITNFTGQASFKVSIYGHFHSAT